MGSVEEGPVAMNYFPQQQQDFKPPLIANENAFLGDVATSEKENSKSPISAGFYRLEKGAKLQGILLQSLFNRADFVQAHH